LLVPDQRELSSTSAAAKCKFDSMTSLAVFGFCGPAVCNR
jgi:hypothetical protein